uniref:Uncharacterized protein n=1 Tax=Arundo donax TaxID=35708 RepID=A0A0A9EJB9_ARUDO
MGAHMEGIEPSPTLELGLADPSLAVDFFHSGHAYCVMVVPFFFSLGVPAVEMVGALALLLRPAHDGAAVVSLFFNFCRGHREMAAVATPVWFTFKVLSLFLLCAFCYLWWPAYAFYYL